MSIPVTSGSEFGFEREGHELRFRVLRLASREWVAPGYVRVRLEGADLSGFASTGSDDHIRLFFPAGEIDPADVAGFREAPSREYTPLAWNADEGWLDLEFAVHGDAGIAAPWAATAPLGAMIGQGGPRGSKVLTGSPDSWLLAGDETAIPAIRRFLALAGPAATGLVLIETADAEHDVPVEAPAGIRVEYVHRDGAAAGTALAARLNGIPADARPAGSVFGFVAAEASAVKPGRALLLDRWGLSNDQVTIRGYWKRGTAEYHEPK